MNPTDSTTDMNEVRERQSYLSLEFFCYYNISHLGVQEFVYETKSQSKHAKIYVWWRINKKSFAETRIVCLRWVKQFYQKNPNLNFVNIKYIYKKIVIISANIREINVIQQN